MLHIQFSRLTPLTFSPSCLTFYFQGKHRDTTPYGEYGGWYKACKVNRCDIVFFFVSDLIIHKIIENHFCSDHIYKKNVLNASLLEKGFKGNQSPWKFAIRNTFSSVLLI